MPGFLLFPLSECFALSIRFTIFTENEKKGVQFNETVEVKSVSRIRATEIDEGKIDRVLHLLHEADPSVDTHDPPELLSLEEEVMEMGPLIDNELEKVSESMDFVQVHGI